jgi:hypothetical protein
MPDVGTLDHFKEWAHDLILDTGDNWVLEPFQEDIVSDVLAGFAEVWTVIPEGNGKTTLLAGIALYHADHTTTAFVPIGASSRDQAEIMYRQAEGFVFRTPGMRAHRKSETKGFQCQEGYRRIKNLRNGSRIQVYAADDRTADGVIPTLAILDELHRHRNLRLYRTWRGKLEKRGGQILTISTAGEPESEFEETRAKIIAEATERQNGGARVRAVGEDIVLHDWALRDRKKADDMDAVAEANPRKDITAEVLRKKRASPTMTDAHWLRFVCDIPAREHGQAILPEDWDALAEDFTPPKDGWHIGFIDLGWRIDCTGLGILTWESSERRLVHSVKVLEPPVDEGDIVRALVERQKQWEPFGWVYDPNAGGAQMVQLLDKGEHPQQGGVQFSQFIEHSQDNAPMSLAAARLDEAVRGHYLHHDGDADLRKHALNTVRKPLGGEKWKYDRPPDAKGERRQKYPIDAFTGLLIGHNVAVDEHSSPAGGNFPIFI